MSQLENLPRPIRQEILRYLLLSQRVRQPPDHLLIEHYKFAVSVLRVSRIINEDAKAVLYGENTFVKVFSNFKDTAKSMLNHEIPYFNLKRKPAFKHHVAEITAEISTLNVRLEHMRNRLTAYLLLLEDIPKYTRLLRLLDFANFMGYEYVFTLRQPPLAASALTVSEQTKLLMPFQQLRGVSMVQRVEFKGAFDSDLAGNIRQAMTQRVAWLRAGIWEVYEIALSIKRTGDQAFKLKKPDIALAKYQDVHTFLESTLTLNHMMRDLDQRCERAICALAATTFVDTALLALADFARKAIGKDGYAVVVGLKDHIQINKLMDDKSGSVPQAVIARYLYLLGVAELGLDHPIKAAKAFTNSYKLISAQPTRQGHEAARKWRDLTKNDKRTHLDGLLAACPKTPFSLADMEKYNTPQVLSEHWVMRELGFKGPIPYADKIEGSVAIILTDKPHRNHHNRGPRTARVGEVQPAALRKHVNHYKQSMKIPEAKGRLIAWIGLGLDDIGEETVLDQLGDVSRGCPPM